MQKVIASNTFGRLVVAMLIANGLVLPLDALGERGFGLLVAMAESTPPRAGEEDFRKGVGLEKGDASQLGEAAMWYKSAAKVGHPEAYFRLGLMYLSGRGVAKDDEKGLQLIRYAASLGDTEAKVRVAEIEHNMGLLYLRGDGVPKNVARGAELIGASAERGHIRAQRQMGDLWFAGVGVPRRNEAEGAVWYLRAARQGDMEAQAAVGEFYLTGKGVRWDLAEATSWLQKAASQGSEAARARLAKLDEQRAQFQALRARAEKGDVVAQFLVGKAFYDSEADIPEMDDVEALKWLRKAAEGGNADAQFMLAREYNGPFVTETVSQDECTKWLRKAAEQGHADAQYELGVALALGKGMKADSGEALKWIRKAAAQGHKGAIDLLNRLK